MPYAYGANINHVYADTHLNVYVTFRHPMKQIYNELPLTPPLELWLLKADDAPVDIIASAWLDEHTLLLTSDEVAPAPTGVTLEYAGPSSSLITTWGKQWEPWGPIPSYAGYPTAPALHNSTHENGGADEIQVDGLSGLLADTQRSFVDRGDAAAWDWQAANLTMDGTWHDLDLSAIVPTGTKAVIIIAWIRDNTVGNVIYFRKKGNANNYNASGITCQVANIYNFNGCIVAVDTTKKIQYLASAGTDVIRLLISGWFL
jgi:hypothetical protein